MIEKFHGRGPCAKLTRDATKIIVPNWEELYNVTKGVKKTAYSGRGQLQNLWHTLHLYLESGGIRHGQIVWTSLIAI